MATAEATRRFEVTADALWRCVRAFGDLSWVPGDPKLEVRGDGVGQIRVIEGPHGSVHEPSLDEDARSLTYVAPVGNPVPVSDYEARMTVTEDGGRGRLTWSCRFEPDGVNEEEAARDLERRYTGAMTVMEAYLKKQGDADGRRAGDGPPRSDRIEETDDA